MSVLTQIILKIFNLPQKGIQNEKRKKEDKILDSTKQINIKEAQEKMEKEMPFVLIQLLFKQGMINKATYQNIKNKYGNLPSCI